MPEKINSSWDSDELKCCVFQFRSKYSWDIKDRNQ